MSLIKNLRPDIDKTYLSVKDPFELKYQLLINRREKVGIKKLKNLKAFIDYSQAIDDVYENLEDYNAAKKRRVLAVFDDMIADMEFNKTSSHIVTELFLRARKLNASLVFISASYFKGPKPLRLNGHIISLRKFLTKKKFNKQHLIIRLTLILKI